MKKISLLLVSIMAMLCFTSCEKNAGDVLKGTWKYIPGYNSSILGAQELEITYIFDGKGKFTCIVISEEERVTKGTYNIQNENIVHLYYSKQNIDGITKEYEDILELDTKSNPPTLTGYAYDSYGNLLQIILYEKQS